MTHVPEIGADNPYHINRHENRPCPIRYQESVPEKFGTRPKSHLRRARNRRRFSGTGFGADFW